jgi:hypothetical protein
MPALFQYAILFLAALLCAGLVLCVRESTDPNDKEKAAARPPEPAAPSLQPRMQPDPERVGSLRAAPSPLAPGPTSSPLRRETAIPRIPRDMPSGEPKTFLPFADGANRASAPPPAVPAGDPPRRPGSATAEPSVEPVAAMTLEPRLPPRPLDGRVDDPADLSGRDAALDQRNDTLWDLVVHLRDYVEQLRSERHTLREEAQMLRDALAEAVEEVRVLRASQLAANSNEQARTAADNPSADPNRLGTAPKRLH